MCARGLRSCMWRRCRSWSEGMCVQCRCLLIFSDNMGGVPHHLINFGSQLAIPREHDQQPPWRATGRPARPVHRVFTCTCSSCTLTFTCTFTEEKTSDQHLPSCLLEKIFITDVMIEVCVDVMGLSLNSGACMLSKGMMPVSALVHTSSCDTKSSTAFEPFAVMKAFLPVATICVSNATFFSSVHWYRTRLAFSIVEVRRSPQ
mmetsp:Transcript_49537/g.67451  ORF Transcript_49537/g.67451 Transcript_49537/m.67451 type:complete len:203 (+) Transcript_49537:1463-2071(+)